MEYKQVDGSHYASDAIATPVTNPITVPIVLMQYCMNPKWTSAMINVEGTLLQGRFENSKEANIAAIRIASTPKYLINKIDNTNFVIPSRIRVIE